MMKLTVPTNWQSDFIKKIKNPTLETVYGKLDRDFVGGGRPSCVLQKVTRRKVKSHIDEIHKEGLKFNYLLNASCMGNREWARAGQKQLNKLLLWLSVVGVDGVVAANPFLLQYIRKNYSHFEVSVSCFANVNSVERAKFWEDLGASEITLSHIELIRNFRLLGKIRESVNCKLQLIVNDNCIQSCPLFFYHNNITSHASQLTTKLGIYMFDYCRLMCTYKRIADPVNFIRTVWIRPEDLSVYENIGFDKFKLVDRSMHTDALALIVNAYSSRSYRGNLYDLLISPSKSLWLKKSSLFHKLKYFFHPFTINIFKMIKNRKLAKDLEVYIDNTKLDGFINYFLNEDCRYKSCKECGYCQEITQKAVRINPEYQQRTANEYSSFLNEIVSGGIFKY